MLKLHTLKLFCKGPFCFPMQNMVIDSLTTFESLRFDIQQIEVAVLANNIRQDFPGILKMVHNNLLPKTIQISILYRPDGCSLQPKFSLI